MVLLKETFTYSKDKVYEVIRIEAFNQLMEVQEVEDSIEIVRRRP